jgi:predicted Zn-dependent protease
MTQAKVIWNKGKTASVVLSKLKEFTISENYDGKFLLRGWFNENNYFSFGEFEDFQEAKNFALENICKHVKIAWNVEGNKCVVLSKLKEFTISPQEYQRDMGYAVRGWYNQVNKFSFGTFPSKEEAEAFLEKLHTSF